MKFSIIIPIYNVEHYIYHGFECLKNQTFKDFEVIFINDGSTDNSLEICKSISQEFDWVKVYTQDNRGSGPARNLGIKKARGRYISFFDIDDILHKDALEIINNHLNKNQVEVLMFGYREITSYTGVEIEYRFEDKTYYQNIEIRNDYVEKFSGKNFNNGFVWNKIYKHQFLIDNNIQFESLRIQQDEVFNLSLYPKVTSLITISDILYDYYVYETGNTRSYYIPERLAIYRRVKKAFEDLEYKWDIKSPILDNYIKIRFIKSVVTYINTNILTSKNSLTKDEKTKLLKSVMQDKDIISVLSKGFFIDEWWIKLYCIAIKYKSVSLYKLAGGSLKLFDGTKRLIRLFLKGVNSIHNKAAIT